MRYRIAPNLANAIDNIYIAVEPVGRSTGSRSPLSVVRWIPYVGWLAGLIMDVYFFGEASSRSVVLQLSTDWLRGITAASSLARTWIDFGVDDRPTHVVWLRTRSPFGLQSVPDCRRSGFCPPRPPVTARPFAGCPTTLGWTHRDGRPDHWLSVEPEATGTRPKQTSPEKPDVTEARGRRK